MASLITRLNKLPAFISYLTAVDALDGALARRFRRQTQRQNRSTSTSSPLVLVQCVEDPYYLGLFGQIANSLRDRCAIRVETYVHRSLNVAESQGFETFFLHRLIVNFLVNRKWVRLYASFCDGVAFGTVSAFTLLPSLLDLCRAWLRWRGLKDQSDLQELRLRGVPAGDLVTDSYLRYKPAATVVLGDFYLCLVIWQAMRNVYSANRYFEKSKPALLLTSYTTYVQHGCAVRVALNLGVPVFSFGNYQEFAKRLTNEDWMHTRDTRSYARDFNALSERSSKLLLADKNLAMRMTGTVDSATSYMKRSAYAEMGEPVPDVKGAVVVFLHDFFDSPNVYHEMVFSDFWQWICFTIETLSAADIPFFLKPHPNQIELSEGILSLLVKQYPQARLLSAKITNKQLAEAGIACGVTVYGTVAHEMAYLGVPSVTSARHPHISFEFCDNSTSRQEYKVALERFRQRQWNPDVMREQACAFYYMHNLSGSEDERELLLALGNLRQHCANQALAPTIEQLEKLSGLGGFENQIGQWTQLLT